MSDPFVRLAVLRSSTDSLLASLDLSDDEIRAPSLLPGWSRGHVLTHIARNADGIARTIAGALRGEIRERYPDNARDRDIEDGARRSAAEMAADVRASAARLDQVFGIVADQDGWELKTENDVPVRGWLPRRWREVQIHHVDLAGRYTADQWPVEFVEYLLPKLAPDAETCTSHPLHIVVDGGHAPSLAGRSWDVPGSGEPIEVRGPDWGLIAWLAGRPRAAAGTLTATPELSPWI